MKKAGAYYNSEASSFCVWAPTKKNVELLLENATEGFQFVAMTRNDQGYWEAHVHASLGTRYRYRIEEEACVPDPASFSQPDGVHGSSQLIDPDGFIWTDQDWTCVSLRDMIFYEIHTGCFSPEHNFEGIRSRLPYLKNLGINTIELMPITTFAGNRNWGYDGVYPFCVQQNYGSRNDLKQLVNEAHAQGIAVILDVVYNHIGPDGNYFPAFGPYFTEKYKSNWGPAFNFDDEYSDGVRNLFTQNALMWLEEFHIDGLRLDAVHAIIDRSAKHWIAELKEAVEHLEKTIGKKKILVAELDLNDPRYLDHTEKGGYGLDGQWIDEFHHALHVLLTGEQNGYYEDFSSTNDLVKAYNESYVYTGEYSSHRKRKFGASALHLLPERFIVFAQNHDQVGNRMLGDRLSCGLSMAQLRLAAAAVLLSPYTPLLFMGEEYGEKNPFQFFIDHTDKELVEKTRSGRKAEFKAFHTEKEVPDPGSEETFNKSCLSWNYFSSEAHQLLEWYRYLIQFRKTRKAMQGRMRSEFSAYCPRGKVIVLDRSHDGERIRIVMNFSTEIQSIHQSELVENAHFQMIYSEGQMITGSTKLTLNPFGVTIFQY